MRQPATKPIKGLICFLVVFAMTAWSLTCLAATEILKVRHWAAPDHTRIVFDVSDEPLYQFQMRDHSLLLEFSNASLHPALPVEKRIGKPGIEKIIFSAAGNETVKIEVVLSEYLKADVFKLKKFMDKPDRVVVDVIVSQTEKEDKPKEPPTPSIIKRKVIVIDPGHGGDDPGAVGKNGTYEKHVVLAISREIKKAIDKIPGFRAVLTRDGDYYVSFNRRLQIARENNASLFISVHADAAKNRLARGGSVYCLSTSGASSEAARILANNENLSDIIGGAPSGEGNNQSDEIILNMFQTNTINLSKTFATGLLDQLGRVHTLKYPVYHQAPFKVLKLLDVPAVLLETAYLSNAQEERMLKKTSFHKTIAQAVALSVSDYFSGSAVMASAETDPKDQEVQRTSTTGEAKDAQPLKTAVYRVKRGDTLSSISAKHETTLAALLKLNQMKLNTPLYVGRKILVPIPVETAAARPLKRYVVKKGDTLYSLAKSRSISVEELRRLNNMSADEALRLGQKIKLPQ